MRPLVQQREPRYPWKRRAPPSQSIVGGTRVPAMFRFAVDAGAARTTVAGLRPFGVKFVEGSTCKRIAGPRPTLRTVLGDTRHAAMSGVLPCPQIFEV